MDADRLTPPSPTRNQVAEQLAIALLLIEHYDDERAGGIADALSWILGEQLFPPISLPDKVFLD